MKDTSDSLRSRWEKDLNSLSGEERVEMACSMFEFSKDLVETSLRTETPTISDSEVRLKTFLRFYAADFSPGEREKIIRYLEALI